MDNSSNSGSSHSNNTQTQNGNRTQRSRQAVDRELPFKDLRELLNHKRQNADGKTGGPPSDPKYNYLSDPMRDGESSSSTNSNNIGTNTNNIGTGRFANQRNFRNPPTNFSTGRGRGNYNPDYHQKPGYSNEPSRFPREWDQGKEDPRNRRYNTSYKNPQQSQHPEGPSSYKQNDTTYFRQRYQDPRPINTNYKGPPHKYNPNYRGGNHQRFPPRRHQHPDPINISVEYNVEDGFRRCTALDVKLDKTWKRGKNRKIVQQQQQQQQQQPPEDEGKEENWDEDAADTRIGGAILETVANEQTEAEDVVEETSEVVEPRKNDGAAAKDRKIGGANKQTEFIVKKPLKVEREPKKKDTTTTRISGVNENTSKNQINKRKDVVGGKNKSPLETLKVKEVVVASTDTKIDRNNEPIELVTEKKTPKVVEEPIDVAASATKTGGVIKETPENQQNKRKDVVEGNNKGLPKPPKVAAASTDTKIDRNEEQSEQVVEKNTPKVVEEPKEAAAAATKTGGVIEETSENQQNERKDIVTDSPETLKVEGEPIEHKIGGEVKETQKNQQNEENNIVEGKHEGSPETSKLEREPIKLKIDGEVEETPKKPTK